jgi:hypothetical protein
MASGPTAINWLPDLRQVHILAQLFCMIQLKVARWLVLNLVAVLFVDTGRRCCGCVRGYQISSKLQKSANSGRMTSFSR